MNYNRGLRSDWAAGIPIQNTTSINNIKKPAKFITNNVEGMIIEETEDKLYTYRNWKKFDVNPDEGELPPIVTEEEQKTFERALTEKILQIDINSKLEKQEKIKNAQEQKKLNEIRQQLKDLNAKDFGRITSYEQIPSDVFLDPFFLLYNFKSYINNHEYVIEVEKEFRNIFIF